MAMIQYLLYSSATLLITGPVGECWYLDVRKPHQAINDGTEMRTHLVVDIEANDEVRALI